MSTTLTDSNGRVATVEAFAAIVVNVMNELSIPLSRLMDPTKTRTPNGFPEAVARALNDAGMLTHERKPWTSGNASSYYQARKKDGSLFPAIERALNSEQYERYEPDDMSPEEDAWILSAGITSEHSEQAEHIPDSTPDSEQSAQYEQEQPPRIDESRAERYEQSEPIEVQSPGSEQSERYEQNTLPDIPEGMKTAFRALAKEVFEEMIHTVPTVMHATDDDIPPKPEKLEATGKGGRRQVREYRKLSATVDSVLFELFRSECNERELSAGRMLDSILWNRYGRPELSYQRSDAEQRARERPKRGEQSKQRGKTE